MSVGIIEKFGTVLSRFPSLTAKSKQEARQPVLPRMARLEVL
jgi:hypothetical protein